MVTSMLDRMLFTLSCGHQVVLGRLTGRTKWICEDCKKETDLSSGPFKAALDKDLDTANQIDLQEKERGKTVERLR
jgi:hypothetical protein